MATIAVITPTIGRASLEQCITRASQYLRSGDIHCVAFDGSKRTPEEVQRFNGILAKYSNLPLLQSLSVSVLRSVSGNAQRDAALSMAAAMEQPSDYAVFCDDDDCLHPDGVNEIHAMKPDGRMHCFLSKSAGNLVGWAHSLELGHVAGGRLCVPLVPDLPKWANINVREADFFFANACKRKFGPPIWHDTPILELDCA